MRATLGRRVSRKAPAPRPAGTVWRVVALAVLLPIAGLATLLSGIGGRPLGEVLAPAALALVGSAAAWLLWRHRPRRATAVVATGVAGVAVGALVAAASPAGPAALGAALDDIDLPASVQQVEQRTGGSVLCFDYCPSVHRELTVDAGPDEVHQHLVDELRDAGYDLEPAVDERVVTTDPTDGPWSLSARTEPGPDRGTRLKLQATATGG